MTSNAPILFIDYCRIPDKYAFLSAFGGALTRHPLYVADGYRGRKKGRLRNGRKSTGFIKVPQTLYRTPLQALFINKATPTGPFGECFDELTDHLAELLRERMETGSTNQAAHNLVAAFDFTAKLITQLNPVLMIIWNQFHPLSIAAQSAARQSGVKTAFIEYGLLPGTLNFDFLGQMGESAIARYPQDFNALRIEEQDIRQAGRLVRQLKQSGANRRKQPGLGQLGETLRQRANGKRIILFAGHNDHASGVIPYDDRARQFHSPFFRSSAEAISALEKIARDNDWFLIYKPHPFASRAQKVNGNECLAVIDNVDINDCIDLADCVVTVLSQVSYVSLIRNKPLVMLGYNQLYGKDCHYQAEVPEEVYSSVRSALSKGFTQSQKAAWHQHVARLMKHYLYRYDGDAPPLTATREPAQLAEIVSHAIKTGQHRDFQECS